MGDNLQMDEQLVESLKSNRINSNRNVARITKKRKSNGWNRFIVKKQKSKLSTKRMNLFSTNLSYQNVTSFRLKNYFSKAYPQAKKLNTHTYKTLTKMHILLILLFHVHLFITLYSSS